MKAILINTENFDTIIRLTPSEARMTVKDLSKFYAVQTEEYYFVTPYVPPFLDAEWPWIMMSEALLREEFNFTLPDDTTKQFEITRK